MQEPVPGASRFAAEARVGDAERHAPRARRRAARNDLRARSRPAATDIVVVVPALASTVEALTGAVDDRRAEAEETANRLAASLPATRAARSARTMPALAVEDALRTFGADEIVVAGDEAMAAEVRSRVTIPVSRA